MLPLPGPSEPIVKDVKSIKRGLDISWSTDVTSKQERYVVSYTRNDTGAVSTQTTTDRGFSIEGLYPGAGYRVQVGSHPSNIIQQGLK